MSHELYRAMWMAASVALWLVMAWPASASSSSCVIYDALMHSGKPDLRRYGIEPVEMVYEAQLWKQGTPLDSFPDPLRVRQAAERARRQQRILVLDIERWPVGASVTDALVTERTERLRTIAGWVRAEYPQLQFGYFGLMPDAAVTWALASAKSAAGMEWRRVNERLQPLAESVDLILPSIYTFSDDKERWTQAAIANIEQARSYGKPVLAFIWYRYSERNEDLGYRYVGDEFWRRQLETVCNHADGAVLWGGWDPERNRPQRWNENEPWWATTRRFIEERSH